MLTWTQELMTINSYIKQLDMAADAKNIWLNNVKISVWKNQLFPNELKLLKPIFYDVKIWANVEHIA